MVNRRDLQAFCILLSFPNKPTRQVRRKSSKKSYAHGHQQCSNDPAFGIISKFV